MEENFNTEAITENENMEAEETETVVVKESKGDSIKEWIRDIAIALIVAIVILQFIKPTIIKESSMEPNLYENNYIFLSKQAYTLFGEPERGDIAVFKSELTTADGMQKNLIKRIIGLPGDEISIHDGFVYINGELLDEPYIKDGWTPGYIESLVVPEGKLFCMGDNRVVSVDSRDERVGCVDIDTIVGKAIFRMYPFSIIGTESSWVEQSKKAAELAGDEVYLSGL